MDRDARPRPIEQFRSFLRRLARCRFPARLQGKLDPSDVVQQTLLEAHARQAQFRGQTEGEQAAWLRLMLLHNLADAQRAFDQARRDLDRECPLPCAPSAVDAVAWDPATEQSSPSQRAERVELARRLEAALADLAEGQREAVVLYYWHGASLVQIAQELGRTPAAAAGLLKRGLKQLRRTLQEPE